MTSKQDQQISPLAKDIKRIADVLERRYGKPSPPADIKTHDQFIWDKNAKQLRPVTQFNPWPLRLLLGIDQQRDILLENTKNFAHGFPGNHALLWGARGMGKSSLIKAIFAHLKQTDKKNSKNLKLLEIEHTELNDLPALLSLITDQKSHRFILLCDDLSFHQIDNHYKSLKTMLEGSLESPPEHLLFYATSNQRHLLPRSMAGNLDDLTINNRDKIDEETSLADRFGLWLGFHNCSQNEYLNMVKAYLAHFAPKEKWTKELEHDALIWAKTRGNRSGRVAWQFIRSYMGREKIHYRP